MANETDVSVSNKIKIIDDQRNTSLHYSSATGNLELVKQDLAEQTKIDVENYLGWTPLMMACRNGHYEVVKFLLEKRADASKKNKFGMTVFLICIASGNLELVQFILQHLLCGGVSKQSLQKNFSPISMAVLFRQPEIIDYLTKQSFNINQQTPTTGITPYMFAIAIQNCKISEQLLEAGAFDNIKNCLGVTAKHMISHKKAIKAAVKESSKQTTEAPQVPKPVKSEQLINVPPPPLPAQPMVVNPHYQQPQQHHQQQPLPEENMQYIPYTPHYPQHKPNLPMIMINSPNQFGVMPSPMGFQYRKSSPQVGPLVTPNLTPITPMAYMPQYFFPPDFNGAQVLSPYGAYYGSEFLNQRYYPNEFPSPNGCDMGYMSPCVM